MFKHGNVKGWERGRPRLQGGEAAVHYHPYQLTQRVMSASSENTRLNIPIFCLIQTRLQHVQTRKR